MTSPKENRFLHSKDRLPAANAQGVEHLHVFEPNAAVARELQSHFADKQTFNPQRHSIAPLKKSTEGSLHAALGVSQDKKIPESKLAKAENSKSPALRKKAVFAENAKHWHHGKR